MVHNPYSSAVASKNPSTAAATADTKSTVPMDQLKRLKQEVKALQQAQAVIAQQQQGNATGAAGSATNGDVNTTTSNTSTSASGNNESVLNTTLNTTSTPADERAALARSIIESNKQNQRLKEMFKDRITTFREAVYLLTGYKVGGGVCV